MKKTMKRILTLALTAMMALTAVPAFAEEETTEGLTQDLVVLYTSDVHCGVEQNFTLAGLAQIRQAYEDAGYYTLLVDDGDFIQGEALGTMTTGEALIDLMNAVGYDVAIPGNHEFDYGMDRFLELTDKAEFPYVSVNFNKEGEPVFDPYVIKEFDGVKFAFLGITTPKTLTSSTPRYFQDEDGNFIYGFFQSDDGQLLYSKVQEAVDNARAEGADYVIAMCHLGNEAECRPFCYDDIITNTTGIDLLLDGHSHDTDQVMVKNKDGIEIPRSAVGTKLACIGTATFSTDGSISTNLLTWELPLSAQTVFAVDNPVTTATQEATQELNEKLSEVVATSEYDLTIADPAATDDNGRPIRIVRRTETNLGDLCADAYRYAGNADIAMANGGGIRVSIPAGDITRNDLLTVHPFNNAICVMEVTGQQILDMLEWGTRVVPEESGGFPQVSGLTYEIHTYLDSTCTSDDDGLFTGVAGEYRVKNVLVGGEPLDLEKTYRLAGTNYILLDEGDGYTMFKDAVLLEENIVLDNQALLNYIQEVLGGVIGEEYSDPYGQGRIVAVEAAPGENAAEEETEAATEARQEQAPAASETQAEQTTEAAAEVTTEAAAEAATEAAEDATEAAEETTEEAAEEGTEAPVDWEETEDAAEDIAEEAPAEETTAAA